MENKTILLIERMAQLNSIDQINEFIETEHRVTKNNLTQLGITFDNKGDISGNQSLSGRENIENSKYYEELSYVRRGLNGRWIPNLTFPDRYDEIQRKVREIKDLL